MRGGRIKWEVENMDELPLYYTILFRAVTQALEQMQEQNYGQARNTLMLAQQQAEEAYLNAT